MCELYCPEDALYVAPQTVASANVEEAARTLIGSYRQAIGWRRGQRSGAADDASYELLSRARIDADAALAQTPSAALAALMRMRLLFGA